MIRSSLFAVVVAGWSVAAMAAPGTWSSDPPAVGPDAPATEQAASGPQQPPPAQPASPERSGQEKPKGEEPPKTEEQPPVPAFEELVVVTASKIEQKLVNAPAAVSLISGQAIEALPVQSYADLFRAVPGVNVAQTSARDINVTSRGASSTLSTSQLALMDGRSIYQDFFGFVAWDFLPISFDEVKQIEVIRGPASAVWGANAMTGVINVITKSPRELNGDSFAVSFGGFDREVDDDGTGAGTLFSFNVTHARAVNDRWSYKLSGGAYSQDALPRPAGTIDNAYNTPYPSFQNEGTTQPKFDARVDYDAENGQRVIVAGGIAGTRGLIHTGIGPFNIQSGTLLGYAKANYSRGAMKINFFTNLLDGEGTNLLAVDAQGQPILFLFKQQTYDLEFGNVQTIGTRHVISYGANFRHNTFDLSLAPLGDNRQEGGFYVQDEIFLSDHFRWLVGARLDKFDVIDDPVFSPRTTFMFKPNVDHTFRVSYNRAFRAPSLVNNYLQVGLVNAIDLGLIFPPLAGQQYVFPVEALGNQDLVEEEMTAYEVGYAGAIRGRVTLSAAFYVNDSKNEIFFTQTGSYSSKNPPPGWPLPPVVLDILIAQNAFGPGNGLPSTFSYLNLGKVRNKGIELGADALIGRGWNGFVNYSWQAEPEPIGFDISELNLPPTNRFNLGVGYSADRYFGSVSLNYQDDAYWQDVLDARYAGPTEAFTTVNGAFGVRWASGRVTTSIKVNNLFNEQIQYHVFGDIMKRQVLGELRMQF